MSTNVLINKAATIERCIARIREDYDDEFRTNYTKQDAIMMNIERACQAAADMAAHVVKQRRLGVPQNTRELFELLEAATIIPTELANGMRAMVGFRNVAVHNYTALDLRIVENVIENHLEDFTLLARILVTTGDR